jgi:hypothetical protein
MMVNLLDDSNFHRQAAVMIRLIEIPLNQERYKILLMIYFLIYSIGIHHIRTILLSLHVNYLKDIRDFGLDKGGADCLVFHKSEGS